jgi:hypothetical protein
MTADDALGALLLAGADAEALDLVRDTIQELRDDNERLRAAGLGLLLEAGGMMSPPQTDAWASKWAGQFLSPTPGESHERRRPQRGPG